MWTKIQKYKKSKNKVGNKDKSRKNLLKQQMKKENKKTLNN